jgi:hypothetical protein
MSISFGWLAGRRSTAGVCGLVVGLLLAVVLVVVLVGVGPPAERASLVRTVGTE